MLQLPEGWCAVAVGIEPAEVWRYHGWWDGSWQNYTSYCISCWNPL